MIDRQGWSGTDARREVPASRILVVDGEPAVRHLIRRLLVEHGYPVHEAGDGHQALQTHSVECPGLPLVMISAYAADELEKFGIVAPCGILAKPLVIPVFLAEVARCLAQRN